MNINYGTDFFEQVSNSPGLNRIRHNPFQVLDFALLVLKAGETYSFEAVGREYGLDIIGGLSDITVDGTLFAACGGRASVFDGKPTLVYVGHGSTVNIEARTDLEVGVGSALSQTRIEPYTIRPDQVRSGSWGSFSTRRHFNYMLDANTPGERISFAEVTVSNGNWATYPPHKHEDGVEGEAFQEEIYFYKVHPRRGMGFCGQFGGRMSEDYAFLITDNTAHKQPYGYHTVTAAPGYSICYLAVYAGHDKTHKVSAHPDHYWYAADYERTLNLFKRDFVEEL